jgi:hypothetical protein
LAGLTHIVKAAYTLLLFVSVGVPIYIPLVFMTADLLPLVLRNDKAKRVAEFVGFVGRAAALGFGFYKTHFNIYLIAAYALLTWLYYRERKRRIQSGTRHDYGWSHLFEHIAIWLYLYAVNYSKLNHTLAWTILPSIIVSILVLTFILGKLSNVYLFTNLHESLPRWFDRSLIGEITRKCRANLFDAKEPLNNRCR